MRKKITTDLILSMLALFLMNGVLQLFVYPVLNRYLGTQGFGNTLYILGVLSIFAPSIGLAANNITLLKQKDCGVIKDKILKIVFVFICFSLPLFLWLCSFYVNRFFDFVLLGVLMVFTTLRYYGDVDYRLTLNYRGYFLYYAALSLGYLMGILIYPITYNWIFSFLLGELICCFFFMGKRNAFKSPFKSCFQVDVGREVLVLACSYLLYNGVLHMDKILLQIFLGSEIVSVYYVASLLGKTSALLVAPLNSIILSYISRSDKQMRVEQFLKLSFVAVGVGIFLFGFIVLINPLFVQYFYPDIIDLVRPVFLSASFSQVICFISSLLLTVLLTFASPKWQLIIQALYAVLFVCLSVVGLLFHQLIGFVYGCLAANFFRFIFIVSIGSFLLCRKCVRLEC